MQKIKMQFKVFDETGKRRLVEEVELADGVSADDAEKYVRAEIEKLVSLGGASRHMPIIPRRERVSD